MTQGIKKEYIFEDTKDISEYVNLMYKHKKEYDINIIAYCIMNNHSHMLLQVKNIDKLSRYMYRINGAYGEYYNKKYDRVGYVFRDRFRSEGIFGEKHLYNCIHYIYNNPVVAGICKDLAEYPYSNYKKMELWSNEEGNFIDVIEDRNIICKHIINEYLKNEKIDISILKDDRKKLIKIVKHLKDDYSFSYKKIADELKIDKTFIYRAYNEK